MTATKLTGTPKQVSWAEKIREWLTANIEEALAKQIAKLPEARREGNELQKQRILGALAAKSEAVWWIEHRNEAPLLIAREIAGDLMAAEGTTPKDYQ